MTMHDVIFERRSCWSGTGLKLSANNVPPIVKGDFENRVSFPEKILVSSQICAVIVT
jgi:hypothetical protein